MDKIISWYKPSEIQDKLVTSAFVICLYQDKLLLGFNNWRNQLEIPAGKREIPESIYETAEREFLEETHQTLSDLKLIEVVELENEHGTKRFRGVFIGRVDEFIEFKKTEFDEMDYITLLEFEKIEFNSIDPIDYLILKKIFLNGVEKY